MENKVASFENYKAYILHVNSKFSYSFYYNNFCDGMTRQQVEDKFKSDVNAALFDIDAIDASITEWIQEQHESDYPIILL
jgi:hypothetical protein